VIRPLQVVKRCRSKVAGTRIKNRNAKPAADQLARRERKGCSAQSKKGGWGGDWEYLFGDEKGIPGTAPEATGGQTRKKGRGFKTSNFKAEG